MNPESPPTPTTPDRQYAVFISYRHADNVSLGRKWANWLHEALENYEVPADLVGRPGLHGTAVPASLYPVFRDEEELPADADLSANIQRALENSGLLVVLCSPRAVSSRFVADEIRHFKTIGRSDRILALMIDGEPNASDDPEKQKRFGAEAECFPEALRFGVPDADGNIDWAMRTEPIAADARPGCRCEQGWTTAAAYDEALEKSGHLTRHERTEAVRAYADQLELAKLKIIAGALGVPLGDLTQRDKARQLQRAKKRTQILFRLSALFAALAIAAGIAGWLAMRNAKRAVKAEGVAVTEKNRAENTLALSYHDRGGDLLKQGDWRAAMTYCAKALRIEPQSPLYSGMAYSLLLHHAKHLPASPPWEAARIQSVAFSPDGTRALISTMTTPLLADFVTGDTARMKLPPDSTGLSFSGTFSASGACCVSDAQFLHVWADPARMRDALPDWSAPTVPATPVRGSPLPHGALLVAEAFRNLTEAKGGVLLINGQTHKSADVAPHKQRVVDAAMVPGTEFLVSIGADKTLSVSDAAAGRVLQTVDLSSEPKRLAVSAASRLIAVAFDPAHIQIFSLADPSHSLEAQQASGEGSVSSLAFSDDGRRLVAGFHLNGGRGRARVWDAATGQPTSDWMPVADWVNEVCFDPEGGRVALLADEGGVTVHDAGGRQLGAFDSGHKGNSISFAMNGSRLAVASDDSRVQLFAPEPERAIFSSASLADEIGSIVVSPDEKTCVTVAPDGGACTLWSLDDLKIIKQGIKPAEGAIHSAAIMGAGEKAVVVLVTKAGGIEVLKFDGTRIAQRPAPPSLDQLSRLDPDKAGANPEPVEVSYFGGDALALDAARSRVIVTTMLLQVDKLSELSKRVAKAGGGTEELLRSGFASPEKFVTGQLLFLDVPSLKLRDHAEAEVGMVGPRLSSDGDWCVVMNTGKQNLMVWHRQGTAWRATSQVEKVSGEHSSPSTNFAISASGRWTAKMNAKGAWVLDNSKPDAEWQRLAGGSRVIDLRFSPDERLIALEVSPSDTKGTAQIWDLDTMTPRSALLRVNDRINSLEFSPDSRLLMTCSGDSTLRLWDTETGRAAAAPIKTGGAVRAGVFIRKGAAILFGGSDRKLCLAATPPRTAPPAWLADALESFGGGALDDSGNERAVSGRVLFDHRAAMLDAAVSDESWTGLARFFWREKSALIPGGPLTPSAQSLTDCLDIWNRGDHSTAVARLREILRTEPDAPVPGPLARAAVLARLKGGAAETIEELDGSKPGSTFHFGKDGGARIWTREAPNLWSEGYPDGHKDHFIVVSTSMHGGDAGEIVRKQVKNGDEWKTENDFEVFVPRLDAARPRIWWRRRNGTDWAEWSPLSDFIIGKP